MEEANERTSRDGRRAVLRDAAGIGLAVGAYGLSYGALAVSAGLTVAQTQLLSLLLYGGSSQLALVGVIAGGGGGPSAAATAALLGVRNVFYGVGLGRLLRPRRASLLPMAHLLSDESAAMAVGRSSPAAARWAYWSTGATVFLCWNLATLAGALAGSLLADPTELGLDAASSAAFLALVAPRLRQRVNQVVFVLACAVAVAASPLLDSGLPVLLGGLVALSVLLVPGTTAQPPSPPVPTPQPPSPQPPSPQPPSPQMPSPQMPSHEAEGRIG
ncbi:AzlC family ABC transporter permease [Streptomyces sp. NPDC005820]|uniref:AzlC family ABC transporter permease n=1 Tax=Streptomyces sp. NPDC005820 TaxID=3157069 RepID=UPI00340A2C8F